MLLTLSILGISCRGIPWEALRFPRRPPRVWRHLLPSPCSPNLTQLPPAQLGIFVFEDNNPTNGSVDGVEEQQGLGGFQIILNDVAGATGDPTGQMTYDMF